MQCYIFFLLVNPMFIPCVITYTAHSTIRRKKTEHSLYILFHVLLPRTITCEINNKCVFVVTHTQPARDYTCIHNCAFGINKIYFYHITHLFYLEYLVRVSVLKTIYYIPCGYYTHTHTHFTQQNVIIQLTLFNKN